MRFLVSCIWVFSSVKRNVSMFDKKKTHPSSFVFAASYAIRPVIAHLQIRDDIAMRPLVAIDLLPGLDIKKRNLARFVSGDNNVWCQCECADSRLRADGVEHIQRFFWFCDKKRISKQKTSDSRVNTYVLSHPHPSWSRILGSHIGVPFVVPLCIPPAFPSRWTLPASQP